MWTFLLILLACYGMAMLVWTGWCRLVRVKTDNRLSCDLIIDPDDECLTCEPLAECYATFKADAAESKFEPHRLVFLDRFDGEPGSEYLEELKRRFDFVDVVSEVFDEFIRGSICTMFLDARKLDAGTAVSAAVELFGRGHKGKGRSRAKT